MGSEKNGKIIKYNVEWDAMDDDTHSDSLDIQFKQI